MKTRTVTISRMLAPAGAEPTNAARKRTQRSAAAPAAYVAKTLTELD